MELIGQWLGGCEGMANGMPKFHPHAEPHHLFGAMEIARRQFCVRRGIWCSRINQFATKVTCYLYPHVLI